MFRFCEFKSLLHPLAMTEGCVGYLHRSLIVILDAGRYPMGGKSRTSGALRTYSIVKGSGVFTELLRTCRLFESANTPRLNIKDSIYFSMLGDRKT